MDPTPHDIDTEIREIVRTLLQDWADPRALDRFLARVADDFTGFGTAPDEHFTDREALRALTMREHADMQHPFTLDIPWVGVRVLRPGLVLAEGEVQITIQMGEGEHVETPRFSLLLDRADGRWQLAHYHFSVPDSMMEPVGTLGSLLEDRTRQLEAEVDRQTAELQQSLADLRAAQARLVQQEKMASLGALTAGIAHEIKNPLNFVNNFATLSRELIDELDAEADPGERAAILADLRTNTEKIEAHGRRADAIVRSMMEHSRGGSGTRRVVDLNALVTEYAGLASHSLRSRRPGLRVPLFLELGPEVGTVEVAPPEIGRVLINLVDNAFDAVAEQVAASSAARGTAGVTVTTRRSGARVEVRVADTGAGMSAAVRDRVFEPFFTTKPTGQGTGLGLSLSHDIVARGHGGALTVESIEGEGTTFTLSLPA